MKYHFYVNQIIRHRDSGHPYLILQIGKPYILVCDLENKASPTPILVILLKDLKYFVPDVEMEDKTVLPDGYWANPLIQFKVKRFIQV